VHGDARRGKDNVEDNYKLHAWSYAINCKDSGRIFEIDQGMKPAVTSGNELLDNDIHAPS
jgi:hypothetical protein